MKNETRIQLISMLLSIFLLFGVNLRQSSANRIEFRINSEEITESYTFEITQSNGQLYFYPIGNISTEVGGSFKLDFIGEFQEWDVLQPFYNLSFYYADGQLNQTIANISEATIGMNFIWGFGGFNPNLISSTDWGDQDTHAYSVAYAPPSEVWPALNGTLAIESKFGKHIYRFQQNPLNGTQSNTLVYHESSGVLLAFESRFGDYHLEAIQKTTTHIEYTILESNGEINFYPSGNVSTEVGGIFILDLVGYFEEWGIFQPFYDISFYYANGYLNKTVVNVSEATIGMNFIWGFGGFSPNLISPTNWTSQDLLAHAVADSDPSEPWPSMSGALNISSANNFHIYEFSQNPLNGTQYIYLKYDEITGVLQQFHSEFEGYSLKAKISFDYFVENQPDDQEKSTNISIASFSGIFIIGFGVISIFMIFLKTHIKLGD